MTQKQNIALTGIILCLIVCFAATNSVKASTYMPNGENDKYIYVDRFGVTSTAEVDDSAVSEPNWRHWTQFAGFGPVWVRTSNLDENIYLFANGKYQIFTNFNAVVGTKWLIDVGACNKNVYATLAARNQYVDVPAGSFNDCIRLDLETTPADCGVKSIWFAKDVGVVKWISQSFAGPNPYEFKEGVVGEIHYPEPFPIALTIKGETDNFIYYIDKMPSIPPYPPPTVLFGEFTISNNTGDSIDFDFGQCEFDIYIYDQAYNMVSHKNRDLESLCAQDITKSKTLEDGETWRFYGNVELTDEEGEDLPEGYYTVDCVMLSTPQFRTSHTIDIQYVW